MARHFLLIVVNQKSSDKRWKEKYEIPNNIFTYYKAFSLNFVLLNYSIILLLKFHPGGGVLDFGLDGGVPPGPRDPNPCLEVKRYPCLGILLKKWTHVWGFFENFLGSQWDPCLGIFFVKNRPIWAARPRIAFLWKYPPGSFTHDSSSDHMASECVVIKETLEALCYYFK